MGAGDLGLLARERRDELAEKPAIPLTAPGASDSVHIAATTEPLGEILEPGRALALADFAPPSLGPGERLVRLAYRLGVPGEVLRSPFSKPPKSRLLATVENPLSAHDVVVPSGRITLVRTGLIIEVPSGHCLGIFARSSTPLKRGLQVANGVGIIDPDYSGPNDEVMIQVLNFTDADVQIRRGDPRQAYGESAAAPVAGAVGLHVASVQEHQPLHQRKPDAEAAFGALERLVALHEHVEYVRQKPFGDAEARVANAQDRFVAFD